MAFNVVHQTPSQALDRIIVRFKQSEKESKAKIAKFILDRIVAGDITDTQLQNKLGLTPSQYTTKKAQMQALVDAYTVVQLASVD